MIAIQDVLLALALAKHVNQPLSVSHASLTGTHLTQMEYASLHVEMALLWEVKIVILV